MRGGGEPVDQRSSFSCPLPVKKSPATVVLVRNESAIGKSERNFLNGNLLR